jgi:hypothetical protein
MQGRNFRDREVVGSNPIAPINKINKLWLLDGSHLLFTTLSTTLSIKRTGAKKSQRLDLPFSTILNFIVLLLPKMDLDLQ